MYYTQKKSFSFDSTIIVPFLIAIIAHSIAVTFGLVAYSLGGGLFGITTIPIMMMIIALLVDVALLVMIVRNSEMATKVVFLLLGTLEFVTSLVNLCLGSTTFTIISFFIGLGCFALAVTGFICFEKHKFGIVKILYLIFTILELVGVIVLFINYGMILNSFGSSLFYTLLILNAIFLAIFYIFLLVHVMVSFKHEINMIKTYQKPSSHNNLEETSNNVEKEFYEQTFSQAETALIKLKKLLDDGIITQQEYEEKRKKHVDSF